MYLKIITLLFCIVATSTIFWANSGNSGQKDQTQPAVQDDIQTQKSTSKSRSAKIVSAVDQMNSVDLKKKIRELKERTSGDLAELLTYIESELKKKHSPFIRNILKAELHNELMNLPGKKPSIFIRDFADRNQDNAEVINEQVWVYVDRSVNGEPIPSHTIAALIYAIDIAATADPQNWHVFDTKSHLHEMNNDLESAIMAATNTLAICPAEVKPKFQKYLLDLQQKNSEQQAIAE